MPAVHLTVRNCFPPKTLCAASTRLVTPPQISLSSYSAVLCCPFFLNLYALNAFWELLVKKFGCVNHSFSQIAIAYVFPETIVLMLCGCGSALPERHINRQILTGLSEYLRRLITTNSVCKQEWSRRLVTTASHVLVPTAYIIPSMMEPRNTQLINN